MWIVPREGFATGVKRSLQNIHHHLSMAKRTGARKGHNIEYLKGIMDSLPPPISFDDFLSPRSSANGTDLPQRKKRRKKTAHQSNPPNPNKSDQSKKTDTTSNQSDTTSNQSELILPTSNFHFPDDLKLNDVQFLDKLKNGEPLHVCTQEKDGGICGFALCNTCKLGCIGGRGARRAPRGDVSNSSNLSEAKKKLLTGCHKDHFKLERRGSDYYGSGIACMRRIQADRVFNCAFCHKFLFALKGKMTEIPELETRFGSEVTEIGHGEGGII